MNLFVAWWKESFLFFRGCSHRRGHLPFNITTQMDLLLSKDSFVFVKKLRAPAPKQQTLQSSFLYHNLQIITSVRKSCSGDYRCCLQTQCHHWLMPILRQWGLCSSDLAGFLQDSCRDRKFFFFFFNGNVRSRLDKSMKCSIKVNWILWLPLVGFKVQLQPFLVHSLQWYTKASLCPRDSRAELPLTSPGTSAMGRRAIDGPKCSKCLPAFD